MSKYPESAAMCSFLTCIHYPPWTVLELKCKYSPIIDCSSLVCTFSVSNLTTNEKGRPCYALSKDISLHSRLTLSESSTWCPTMSPSLSPPESVLSLVLSSTMPGWALRRCRWNIRENMDITPLTNIFRQRTFGDCFSQDLILSENF